MNTKPICGIPFSEITIHPDIYGGNNLVAVPCCSAWLKEPYSKFKLKVNEDCDNNVDIMGIWNSKEIKEFRRTVLEGSYTYCRLDNCPQWQSNCLLEVPEKAKPYIEKKELHLDYPPVLIKACIDLACNLACPSCRLIKKPLADEKSYKRVLSLFNSGTRNIYLNGSGEIFINRYLLKALQEFSCKKYPNIDGFYLITNGTFLNKTTWYSLPDDFKKLIKDIWISVDTPYEETYKKLRIGGNFSVLKKNLEFVSDLRQKGELINIALTCVLQKTNVHEVFDFVKFAVDLKFDRVVINKIQDWSHQEIKYFEKEMCLPENWKDIYKDDIFKAKELIKQSGIQLISNII